MPTKPKDAARERKKKRVSLRALYDKHRREFSAADLQKFTEVEPGIPIDVVIAGMEEIQRQEELKMKAKKKRK